MTWFGELHLPWIHSPDIRRTEVPRGEIVVFTPPQPEELPLYPLLCDRPVPKYRDALPGPVPQTPYHSERVAWAIEAIVFDQTGQVEDFTLRPGIREAIDAAKGKQS